MKYFLIFIMLCTFSVGFARDRKDGWSPDDSAQDTMMGGD